MLRSKSNQSRQQECHDGLHPGQEWHPCQWGIAQAIHTHETEIFYTIATHWEDDVLSCWGLVTGCIKGFFEAEKYVENGIKTTDSISIFCALGSVMKVEIFQK